MSYRRPVFERRLFYRDDSPDRYLREKASRDFTGQSNAAVRSRIIRYDPFVHAKIEATQAHEIRHIDFVNGGAMIAFLVRDHILTGPRRIPLPTGRTNRLQNRDAIAQHFRTLRGERNFDTQLIR